MFLSAGFYIRFFADDSIVSVSDVLLDLLGQKLHLTGHVSLHTVAFRRRDVEVDRISVSDSFFFINVVLFPVFAWVLSLPSCRASPSLPPLQSPTDRPQMESACRTMTDSAGALQHIQPELPAAAVTEHHFSGFTRVYVCLSAAAICHQHLLRSPATLPGILVSDAKGKRGKM